MGTGSHVEVPPRVTHTGRQVTATGSHTEAPSVATNPLTHTQTSDRDRQPR